MPPPPRTPGCTDTRRRSRATDIAPASRLQLHHANVVLRAVAGSLRVAAPLGCPVATDVAAQ
eukprot:124611-Alexandrium_andersonii.AAC.1